MAKFTLNKYKRTQFNPPEIDDETMRKFGEKLNEHIHNKMAEMIAQSFGVPAEYWRTPQKNSMRASISFHEIALRLETEALIMREWHRLQYERALSKLLIIKWRKVRSVAYLSLWALYHRN